MELRGWIRGGTQQLGEVKIPDSEWGSARRWGRGMRALGSLNGFCSSEAPRTSRRRLLSKRTVLKRHSDRGFHGHPLFIWARARLPSGTLSREPDWYPHDAHLLQAPSISLLPPPQPPALPCPYFIRAWSTLEERRVVKRRATALGDVLGLPSESPLSSSPMALM